MINNNLTPVDKFIKFIEPAERVHGRLKIMIKVYDEPVMTTEKHNIFTTVEVFEEDDTLFGKWFYEKPLNEKQVKEQFDIIIADPMKYKTIK